MGFHPSVGCPSGQEETRGERWQPREGRAKRGDRRKQPELLPLYTEMICKSPWVNSTKMDLNHLTIPHVRGLPSRQGVPSHKRL